MSGYLIILLYSLIEPSVCQGLNVEAAPIAITVPATLQENLKSFEPSAALYLDDISMYLVATDDTTEKDDALLFLMNDKGWLQEKGIAIQGLKKMMDMESLSTDEAGALYLMSSLGLNKNGKEKSERNLFVKMAREGSVFKAVEKIDLRSILLKALKKSELPEIENLKDRFEAELDVESHLISRGELLVGLKSPQALPGQSLLLNLGDVAQLFKDKKIGNIEVSDTLDFYAVSGDSDQASDILQIGDQWTITTTTEQGSSRLWQYHAIKKELTLLKEYSGSKAEGLAYDKQKKQLMIVFDQGIQSSLFDVVSF